MPTSRQRGRIAARGGSARVSPALSLFRSTYFGGHELGGSAERLSRLAIPHLLLAQSVVCHLHVSIKSQEDIVQLQVAVDDTLRVEILKGKQDLARVELGLAKRELLLLDVQHQVAARDILHDEVHTSLGLKTRVQVEQEGMTFLCGGKVHPLFRLSTTQCQLPQFPVRTRQERSPLHFVVLDNELLLQHLDRIQAARHLLLRQHDFSEVALTQHRKEVEVVQADLATSAQLLL